MPGSRPDDPAAPDALPERTAPSSSTEPSAGGPRHDPPAGLNSRGRVKRTRAGAAWVGLVAAAVLAILLLIFIAQNSRKVPIKFLGFDGRISFAIALLLATAIGILIVAIPGGIRITQLRRDLRRNAKERS